MNVYKKNSTFVGHFCPPGSGSTDPIESGSATLPVVRHGLAALQHPLLRRLADELEFFDATPLVAELAVHALELLLGLGQQQLHVALPEMKFLDINSTKDWRTLLLYAIHSPFYWRILKKTIGTLLWFKNPSIKSAKLESIHEQHL
jgi:hypothetical protein